MSIEQNRATVLEFIKTMEEHDGVNEGLVTNDFLWWSPDSGFMDLPSFKALVRRMRPLLERLPKFTIKSTVAEGNRVAVEMDGKCTLVNGKPYNNNYCFLFEFEDGRIKIVKEYNNSRLAASTFAELIPELS